MKWFSNVRICVLAIVVILGVLVFPIVQMIWAAVTVDATARKILPETWNQMYTVQRAVLVHQIQCQKLHAHASGVWFLPQTTVDIILIWVWDCDPIEIWKMRQITGS